MKKISLFIVVFSFCLWAKAQQAEQNEESYSTIGQKRWEMQYQDEDRNNKFMEYEMENISDTLINGLRYVPVSFYEKALEVTSSCIELKMDYDHRDTIFCRQEGEKVYFVPKGGTEDFLVLDYGLNIGDSYTNPAGDEFVVVERGTFPKYASQVYTYGKRAPMMLKLQSKDGTKEDVWIEGLGSTVWGIDPRLSAYNAHTCFARTGGRNDHELDAVYNVFLDKYKFASLMPQEPERHETDESWSVSFHADTLCVKGVAGVRDFNGPNYFEMIVTEDNVIAMTDFLSPHSHPYISNKYTDIDVRIPGFEAGTYMFGTESLVCEGAEDDYLPFVEKWKQWHVLGFNVGDNSTETNYFFESREVTIGEHTYLNLYEADSYHSIFYLDDNVEIDAPSLGLFREEDRRVYLYDQETEQEYCVYDFTLKVGDTFDIGIGDNVDQSVVTEVGYITVKGKQLRTITLKSVNPNKGGSVQWVEGIGSLGKPTDGWNPDYDAPSSWNYRLAYMVLWEVGPPNYYPFSFRDVCGTSNFVYGQELVQGEEMTWDEYLKNGAPLYYEIISGKLHVWGYMWLQPCPNYYVYCILSPKDDYRTYTVTLEDEIAGVETTCLSTPHAVDLYFDLPSPESEFKDYDYIFIDEDGEHPIVNHDKYRPFVEEGKVWKVVWTEGSAPAQRVMYYYLDGDTIFDGQSYKKMMCRDERKDSRKTSYEGAIREDNKKVYYLSMMTNKKEELLYDFGANVGDELNVFPQSLCKVTGKDTISVEGRIFPRINLMLQNNWFGDEFGEEEPIEDYWLERIGYMGGPCEGISQGLECGMYFNSLTCCTIGSDTLFYSSENAEDVSPYWSDEDDPEVKRETLDFTHVIKTKPTSPLMMATPTLLRAEYNDIALFIHPEGMTGQYQISIRKDNEVQDHFASIYNLGNLQSIDVNLAGYPEGEYTITVENDQELFTAHFVLPLDGTGINEIENEEMRNGENENAIYDLSGRKISGDRISNFKINNSKLQKGIYIRDGKKVVLK